MIENKENKMPSGDDKSTIKFGLSVIAIVFGIIGVWAAFAPLSSSSVASAVVSAGTNKKIVQHLEGGIIKEIFIKNGDFVEKGEILIKLSDIQFKADFDILTNQYANLLGVDARLAAYKNNENQVNFPISLLNDKIIKEQNDIFYTKMKLIQNEKIILKKRISQFKKQKDSLKSQKNTKKVYLKSISEEIVELEDFLKDDLIDKIKFRELKRSENQIKGELEKIAFDISEKDIQISGLYTEKIIKEKEFENITLEQIVETKKNLLDTVSKLTILDDRLKRTNVIAPKSGVIVNFNYSTIGEVVNPRETILEILPKDIKLNLLARVSTTDIDKVRAGLEADIIFSAFNLKNLAIIKGKVISISADSLVDKSTGETYYEAKVEVNEEGLETLKDNNLILVSGMPAQVMIKIGGRTALQYFVKPFQVMLMRSFNEE